MGYVFINQEWIETLQYLPEEVRGEYELCLFRFVSYGTVPEEPHLLMFLHPIIKEMERRKDISNKRSMAANSRWNSAEEKIPITEDKNPTAGQERAEPKSKLQARFEQLKAERKAQEENTSGELNVQQESKEMQQDNFALNLHMQKECKAQTKDIQPNAGACDLHMPISNIHIHNPKPYPESDTGNKNLVSGKAEKEKGTKVPEKKSEKQSKVKNDFFENPALNTAFLNFVDHRKKLKSAMTEYAIRLAVNKLNKSWSTDEERILVIQQSIENGWKGLFPLREVARSGTSRDWRDEVKDWVKEESA
jgi:hypothetical protein